MTTGEASLSIRSARPGDAAGVTRIYNHYIGHSVATFEIRPVSEPIVARRMAGILERFPWLVAVADERLLGYAYATAWKPREAYAHTVETTIYLDHELCGRGLGERLYRRLLTELEAMNVHAALGGIALPNPASVALHEKLGYRKVAHLKEVGWKFGAWVDVGYWQLTF